MVETKVNAWRKVSDFIQNMKIALLFCVSLGHVRSSQVVAEQCTSLLGFSYLGHFPPLIIMTLSNTECVTPNLLCFDAAVA